MHMALTACVVLPRPRCTGVVIDYQNHKSRKWVAYLRGKCMIARIASMLNTVRRTPPLFKEDIKWHNMYITCAIHGGIMLQLEVSGKLVWFAYFNVQVVIYFSCRVVPPRGDCRMPLFLTEPFRSPRIIGGRLFMAEQEVQSPACCTVLKSYLKESPWINKI